MTNNGCNELYLSWAKCARILKYEELESLLIERTKSGFGCVADGIDEEYLSKEFCVLTVKKQFHEVMLYLLKEISSMGVLARNMDVNWNSKLQEYWLERLYKIEKALYLQLSKT